ncbi:MAG TPA: hypothetical protein VFW87_01015 [Pirellulales bacterium]|nr:hypothetical protein [Pirellulales bacterium]
MIGHGWTGTFSSGYCITHGGQANLSPSRKMKKKAVGSVRRANPNRSANLQRDREIRETVRHE